MGAGDSQDREDIRRIFEKQDALNREFSEVRTRLEVAIAQRAADEKRWEERHEETTTTVSRLRADMDEIQRESRHQLWWAFTALAGALGAIVMTAWKGLAK